MAGLLAWRTFIAQPRAARAFFRQRQIGFDIELTISAPMALIYLLHVHPSRQDDLQTPENFHVSPPVEVDGFIDQVGKLFVSAYAYYGDKIVRSSHGIGLRDTRQVDQSLRNLRRVSLRCIY